MQKLSTDYIKNLTEEELLKVLEEEVFQDADFIRHIQEVSKNEQIPHDVVEEVIKHHITRIGKMMIKKTRHKRRITLFGFLNIDILEPTNNEHSIYYKQRKK